MVRAGLLKQLIRFLKMLSSKLMSNCLALYAMAKGSLKAITTTESVKYSQSIRIRYIVSGTKLPKGWEEHPLGGHHGANGYAMAVKHDKRKNKRTFI
jgi:hypothetical protein